MLTADVIELLKPGSNGPLLVITVGNRLRSDDGVAPYIAECAKRPKNGIIILDAGERPEDILWKAIEVRPESVVIIDAADFGGEPGEVRAIPEEFIPENPISTHRFPPQGHLKNSDRRHRGQGQFHMHTTGECRVRGGFSDRVRLAADEIVMVLNLTASS